MERRDHNERRVLSVSELTGAARTTLEERFALIWVEGEIADLRRPSSGHWYFTLKDERAQLRGAMFANRNRFMRFRPKDGDHVTVRGRLSIYQARGDFQLIAEHMEPAGEGVLKAAIEQLEVKLAAEGLLAPERKRALPLFPRHVAVITSPHGAAVRDVLNVLARRCAMVRVTVLPVAVQGTGAAERIAASLARLGQWPDRLGAAPDVAIVTRGGGSLEDLMAFNTETVARAIAVCPIPVVSAVGHEIDVTVSDLVADVRAPTPSAAAELVSPDLEHHAKRLRRLEQSLGAILARRLAEQRRTLAHVRRRLVHPGQALRERMQRADEVERRLTAALGRQLDRSALRLRLAARNLAKQQPGRRIGIERERLDRLGDALGRARRRVMQDAARRLDGAYRALNTVGPASTLERGYAILARERAGTRFGDAVTDAAAVTPGERLVVHLRDGQVHSDVVRVEHRKDD